MKKIILLSIVTIFMVNSLPATEVGEFIEVAPKVENTRNQTWASTAWNEGAKCWLVVWREGYLNELISDIWCARISVDGKVLDPEGIRLSSGKGLKDMPAVASDGKGFLVAWEDLRNGKDWDLYATRISGEGIVQDVGGILIAGGEHNQCRASIAFAKGNYHLVWMGFADTRYAIYGACIPADSKETVATPLDISPVKVGRRGPAVQQLLMPAIAANKNGDVLLTYFYSNMGFTIYAARVPLDGATGKPIGDIIGKPIGKKALPLGTQGAIRNGSLGIALGPDNAIVLTCTATDKRSVDDITVGIMSKKGVVSERKDLGSSLTTQDIFKPLISRPGAVFDGKSYLCFDHCLRLVKKKTQTTQNENRTLIVGWRMSSDGTVEDKNGFLIAGEGKQECMLPAAAAGSEGRTLVVYSDARGVDDVKVLARIIK